MNKIRKKVLFQMDPFDKLNIKTDSTISIIKEALNFGIKVYVNNPDDLTLKKNSIFGILGRTGTSAYICLRVDCVGPYNSYRKTQTPVTRGL